MYRSVLVRAILEVSPGLVLPNPGVLNRVLAWPTQFLGVMGSPSHLHLYVKCC